MHTVLYEEFELAVGLQVGISAQEILIYKKPSKFKEITNIHKYVLST